MLSTLKRRYPAYTLLELLLVLSIFSIIGGMTFASFDGLQNTVKMNEYMLNLEQDVRTIQRESMLLERTPGEDWL
ncbi:MAG TPA: prepilin-type N-terminal cleavage/methylation domain-containing protein, partial [Candidatus Dojkabacteria bacterium]|nr:prepilin-type N-terminal cleavage/methylation domain-containing protein [Candidatus Dojkabacteria bacterium]